MTRWTVAGALSLSTAWAIGSCTIYGDDLLVPAEPGSGGSAEGGGGGGAGCDCPDPEGDCRIASCNGGICGEADAPAGDACREDGGAVCDGAGVCVGCLDEDDCAERQTCALEQLCVTPGCDNDATDGSETDVDCGGSCDPCADGQGCMIAADCQSGVCDGGSCGLCDAATDCDDTSYCDGDGHCAAKLDDGTACAGPEQCLSGVCETTCQIPACDDTVENGSETDVDCGGDCAQLCADGLGCVDGEDCVSGVCLADACQVPACGDMVVNGGDQCDDGDTEPFDGCSPGCFDEADHLIISEVRVTPTAGEFVEIFNPTSQTVDLSTVYLADYNSYYLVTMSGGPPGGSDFRVRFPNGASLAPASFVVVAIQGGSEFDTTYGELPDFDLDTADMAAPTMVGNIGGSAGLTDAGEMLILFSWSSGDLVTDLDYVVWGANTLGNLVDKTDITVGSSTYLDDTPTASQVAADKPDGANETLQRCDSAETSEASGAGNGFGGDDETSENGLSAFSVVMGPTPGAPPIAGSCP